MHLLFVKRRIAYPRSSGHDVHTWEMMRALVDLGHEVSFGSLGPIEPAAVAGIALVEARDFAAEPPRSWPVRLSALQERFRRYWGIDTQVIGAVGRFARERRADATVLVGLDILPCLGGVTDGLRIWYAGDEWARHHLSLVNPGAPATWKNLKPAAIKGAYEWAFASAIDRVWVVSDDERRAARRIMRTPRVDVIPNGVDGVYFSPSGVVETPASACFWGRLDFEPNIDAVTWFCREVWPAVRAREGRAVFTVYGFQPTAAVEELCARTAGVRLVPNLPDLRREIESHAVVVLPFVSGGGIKNKLLEAAALARPIVASPKACEGLRANAPVVRATRAEEWVAAILELWRLDDSRSAQGLAARQWVSTTHSWRSAARVAAEAIGSSLVESVQT